ncbi:MAG: MFS transporter [Rikenellaceae bacterium]
MSTKNETAASTPLLGILLSLSLCHCCNDALQAVVNSLYPILKDDLVLSFVQIGVITLCYQLSASILQPLMGIYLDHRPNPWFITLAACFTFSGLTCLAFASSFWSVIASVILVGMGSSIVHPEASRLTSLASKGRRGLAQSIFQVGGNLGNSIGPLLAALVIAPYGRENTAFVALLSFVGIGASIFIARWYRGLLREEEAKRVANGECSSLENAHKKHKLVQKGDPDWIPRPYSDRRTYFYIGVLLVLIFSKYVYVASLSSYYTFFTMEKFGFTVQESQYALFLFIFATALGTLVGGPVGDKIGRKYVIWASILGAAPFALALPHLALTGTLVCSFFAGFMLSSAFPAIVILAQELLPNRLGMISGLFFGFAFGFAGVAAAFWGGYAESHGVEALFNVAAFMPLLGIVAMLLPKR